MGCFFYVVRIYTSMLWLSEEYESHGFGVSRKGSEPKSTQTIRIETLHKDFTSLYFFLTIEVESFHSYILSVIYKDILFDTIIVIRLTMRLRQLKTLISFD